jgi:hypothetical protein
MMEPFQARMLVLSESMTDADRREADERSGRTVAELVTLCRHVRALVREGVSPLTPSTRSGRGAFDARP